MFGVVETWIESWQMMEFLTPVMQDKYLASMSTANWRSMLSITLQVLMVLTQSTKPFSSCVASESCALGRWRDVAIKS
ncbi:MAG: hypothetical protein EOP13_00655 [Pseudomonas sp.]|uniref:hypothetical protein n=1 Tax=Pseudomonas sp. TaxID=306 RepID=UPI001202A64D|nr:hypothetical protein [Pseudomonas sp.]RZI76835.1 MAG: hypothetical protein EOP13_00655 [Pseudomonas sp.]